MKQRTAKKLQRNFLRVKLGYSYPQLLKASITLSKATIKKQKQLKKAINKAFRAPPRRFRLDNQV